MKVKILVGLATLWLAACTPMPVAVTPATSQERSALFDQLKPLEGYWNYYDANGKWQGTGRITLTSGGAVLREVMFPGKPHEMTNLYHMDGGSLLMTHYCASGNQPRLRMPTHRITRAGEFDLRFDSITNWASGEEYMGRLQLAIADKDHATQTWTWYKAGKATTNTFTLKRQPPEAKPVPKPEACPTP
ncbi:MAG: hypothetical protein AABY95_10615 [Pseudomonadota bacterium]